MSKYEHFSAVPQSKLREYQLKSTYSRSPNLKKAWDIADKLRKEHHQEGMSVASIAKKYEIGLRSAYKIINGR